MTTPSDPAEHGELPLLSCERVLHLVAQGHHVPVAQLPALPNDGGGEGDASLYFFPAPTTGDTTEQHRDTWAVVVDFPDVAEDVDDCSTHATEHEARDAYGARVATRLGLPATTTSIRSSLSTSTGTPDDFLAALADLPVLDVDQALDDIVAGGHTPVAVLELLPDDGLGPGDAFLYRLPARTDGDPELRHRETWVVSVEYDGDGDGDTDALTAATQQKARELHSARVASYLAQGCPDPGAPTGEQVPRRDWLRQQANRGHQTGSTDT